MTGLNTRDLYCPRVVFVNYDDTTGTRDDDDPKKLNGKQHKDLEQSGYDIGKDT